MKIFLIRITLGLRVFTQGEGVNSIQQGYTEAKGLSVMDLQNQVAANIQEPQPGCSRQVPQAEPSFKRNLGIN